MPKPTLRTIALISILCTGILDVVWLLSGGSWFVFLLVGLQAIVCFAYVVRRTSADT